MQHRSMAALTLLQKQIHHRDLNELLEALVTLMLNEFMTGQQVLSLVNYMLQAGETPNADAFIRKLVRRVPQHEVKLMTIAQQLEQKGLEMGIKRGRQEGIAPGERETRLEIARTMLENGMDISTVIEITGLSEEDLLQLRH